MTEHAEAIDIPGLEWSAGAPEPAVLMSEDRSLIAFYCRDDSSDVREVGTAEFVSCTSLQMGFPNDEAQHGHPLWGHGLEFYRAHVVIDSSWLAELRAIESVHAQAPAVPLAGAQHFVLTFHDSMVEAIAGSIQIRARYRTMGQAIEALVAVLNW